MFKIAPEGLPFIICSAILTFIIYASGRNWIAALPALLTLFIIFFFRDPDRVIPEEEGAFVSPADGRIIVIKDVFDPLYLKKKVKLISIFMSPFNVHVNRSPVTGKVSDIIHTRGDFHAAYKDSAAATNENTVMILDSNYGRIAVRQVAGFIARRIVCRVRPGDNLSTGQKYGIIKFGSRVDIFLPEDVEVVVVPDKRSKAGETILARAKR